MKLCIRRKNILSFICLSGFDFSCSFHKLIKSEHTGNERPEVKSYLIARRFPEVIIEKIVKYNGKCAADKNIKS